MKQTLSDRSHAAFVWVVLIAAAALPICARAASVTVPNFSFESPVLSDGAGTSGPTTVPSWTGAPSTGIQMGAENPNSSRYAQTADVINDPRANGKQYGYINTYAAGETGSLTSGDLTTVASNTRYTLTVSLGNGLNIHPSSYKIELLVSGVAVATQQSNGGSIPQKSFAELTALFDAPTSGAQLGKPIQIRLTQTNVTGISQPVQGHYDNVRLTSGPIPPAAAFTVTAIAGANGTVSPSSQTVNSGGSVTFTATPNAGYVVDYWFVSVGPVYAGATYTLGNVTANQTVSVSFKVAPLVTFTVTPSAGAGGAISPSSPQTVQSGSGVSFTATPNSGYVVSQWLVNGTLTQSGGSSYTVVNVTANRTVQVTFAAAPPTAYTVTPSAGANGTITPSSPRTVSSGSSVSFTAASQSGYAVSQWLDNGAIAQTGGSAYTASNVTFDRTVQVYFRALLSTYTVTPSAGPNGNITPSSPQTVRIGESVSFTAIPANGYVVYQWLRNGSLAQSGGSTYIAGDVTANQTVQVTFSTGAPTPTATPNVSALLNISTRLAVGTADDALIGGFIVTGALPKKVLIRAIGPSLPIVGALADPVLELHAADNSVVLNNNWRDNQQAEIVATTIAPLNDFESAIVATLSPGAYAAIVRGNGSTTGVGLIEVYDLDRAAPSKLANISSRGFVGTGDNVMIGGLIIGGVQPLNLILRALGPSLLVAGALADPVLDLADSNGNVTRTTIGARVRRLR